MGASLFDLGAVPHLSLFLSLSRRAMPRAGEVAPNADVRVFFGCTGVYFTSDIRIPFMVRNGWIDP